MAVASLFHSPVKRVGEVLSNSISELRVSRLPRLAPIPGTTAATGRRESNREDLEMRKWLMALLAVAVLSVGVAWGEGKNEKTNASCPDNAACCCCSKSCPK